MRRFIAALAASLAILAIAAPAAMAQTATEGAIPDRRFVVTQDVDFPGNDLQALFDTTYDACEAACRSDDRCRAFTFNTRSRACFPKSQAGTPQVFAGALSAARLDADPAVLARGQARAGDLAHLGAQSLTEAAALARRIGWHHPAGQYDLDQMLQAAQQRRGAGDTLAAMNWTGGALSLDDRADLWVEYARLALSASNEASHARLRERVVPAAINGYLRAGTDAGRVAALEVLAQGLEASRRGRDMIPTLRLALGLQARADLSEMLDSAIGKYGFRVTDTQVDGDNTVPRVCAQMSERLHVRGFDYSPYVRLPDQTLAVTADPYDLCIEGLRHGQRYQITLREGLPAAGGETLARDVTLNFYVRDRAPTIQFPGRAYVLPRGPEAALPVQTVNLGTVDLTLRRINDRNILRAMQQGFFGQSLGNWDQQRLDAGVAETVWTGVAEVGQELNQQVTTRLPLAEALADQGPGLFALTASVPGADAYGDRGATQWFVLSDLGMTTLQGHDGLHVLVRGLGDAQPRAGVRVALMSRANRVLAEAETDAMGHARFDAGLTRGTGGAAPALVTLSDATSGDFAFLSLSDPAFDLSDRGVEGREPPAPVDVFIATDRGAYRAGDVIHVTALARDAQAAALPGLPLLAILTRPDGVEYSRHMSADDRAGGHVFALPLAPSVPRGTWTLALKADPDAPALASRTLLVEDFLPERIDFDLSLPAEGALDPARLPDLALSARYLFGAPAADLAVEGDLRLVPVTRLEGFAGYVFGRHDETAQPRRTALDSTRTDATGAATVPLRLPQVAQGSTPLEARITLRVAEGSNRPVERQITRPLAPATTLIGIRPGFDGDLPEGTEARFDLIATGPGAGEVPARWVLNRVETRYQWYQQYGDWMWEPVTTRSRVAGGDVTLGQTPVSIAAMTDWGRYELVVSTPGAASGGAGGADIVSSTSFYAGWFVPADTATTPDMLDVSLDRTDYRPGDTARLRIVPRAGGEALITVLSDRLISMQSVTLPEGETVIDLPVTDDWGSGAYVTAQLVRPMDQAAGRNPARALGLTHAAVDPGARALQVAIDAPGRADPRAPLTATLRVDGISAYETAHVTVAAVDLGILNLTAFASPDPSAHYFAQRRLGVEMRDLYGRLIDGMTGAMGQVRSGGDAGAEMRLQSPPPTEDLLAQFSGPVTVGPDGTATVTFDLPAFNGTVRLMAVAWSASGVGQAEADVVVADPVVLSASLPRFLAPGDTSRLLLELTHADGPAGTVGLHIDAPAGLDLDLSALPAEITLAEGGTDRITLPLTAREIGDHVIGVTLRSPDGRTVARQLALGVRSNDPPVSTTRQIALDAGQSLTLGSEIFANLRPGTGSATLSSGPLARLDVPALLMQLDRYPYGCTEQLASQALPLLYLSSVAEPLGLGNGAEIRARIDQSVAQVLTRQSGNGSFGLWQAGSGDFWLDAYVTDFLSRARAAGHTVPETAFAMALDNLRNRVNYAADFDEGGQALAYALLVLAREGAAAMGDLRYYADEKGENFATGLAAAQLGAALASYGDPTRADAMFGQAARHLARIGTGTGTGTGAGDEAPLWRADYGSGLRDMAGVLALAIEAGSTALDTATLSTRIAAPGRDLSTQEAAWTLMAARAMIDDPGHAGLSIDGAPAGVLLRRIEPDLARPLALRNDGPGPVAVTLSITGVPQQPEPAGGYGMGLTRAYFTLDGEEVSPENLRPGTRLVTVLTVTPFQRTGARLMIDDPLPAGFEIDNPNLLRGGDIAALDWLVTDEARHAEFRAERFLAAVDLRGADPVRVAYVVRAVSPGLFHHPAAQVEDMYRPHFRAWSAAGTVRIDD